MAATGNPVPRAACRYSGSCTPKMRPTTVRVARLAATAYKPTKRFQLLKDYSPFAAVANSLRTNITAELLKLPLKNYKRVAFYYLGAGEGLLLDRINPRWRERYFKDKFSMDSYF